MANYVSYADILKITREIGRKFDLLGGAFVIKGAKAFANLPAPSAKTVGFVYNVTDEFTTTADFVEGASKTYPAGTNVVVVNAAARTFTEVSSETLVTINSPKDERYYELTATSNGEYVLTSDTTKIVDKTYYTVTDSTPSYKYDVMAGFIDVDSILENFADEFSTSTAYEEGDIVLYDNRLYKFTSNHAAGAWDISDVETTTVAGLMPSGLSNQELSDIIGLL